MRGGCEKEEAQPHGEGAVEEEEGGGGGVKIE